METNKTYSLARLLVRSLLPSAASVSVGLLVSAILLGLHILFFSLNVGSFAPGLASDQWIQTYTNFIIHPLETFFHNSTLNTLLTAVVWGFVGLVIYTTLEASINAYNNWYADKHQVHIIDSKKIELHPLRRLLLTRALWRLLISILVVMLIVLTGRLSHHLLVAVDKSLDGKSVMTIVEHIGLTVAAWTLLIHCYVVLLRLFMFRTRISGELIQ